jgi:hypothetical protein
METQPASETLFSSYLEYRTMDTGQKSNNSEELYTIVKNPLA